MTPTQSASADEPMAVVRWDFAHPIRPDVQVKGYHAVRRLSDARRMAEIMNADYGEGSHWVEPQNVTWEEYWTDIQS